MNSSLKTADRTTHLKIVVMSLVASIAVVVIGIAAHTAPDRTEARLQVDMPVVKAGQPMVFTRSESNFIR
ncbi:MAG TPA: hypothetical protein VHA77_08635 [Xanthobacteraceae bacterium]|jgi:hypothetical protein|nr:hypothetical protein [Xanthobacteraceae bacterium]